MVVGQKLLDGVPTLLTHPAFLPTSFRHQKKVVQLLFIPRLTVITIFFPQNSFQNQAANQASSAEPV